MTRQRPSLDRTPATAPPAIRTIRRDASSPVAGSTVIESLLVAATLCPTLVPTPASWAGVVDEVGPLEPFCAALSRIGPAFDALEPGARRAWVQAALHRVAGRPQAARSACVEFQARAPGPIATACLAETESLLGDPDAYRRLRDHVMRDPPAEACLARWLQSMLAEMALRDGHGPSADTHLRLAAGLGAHGPAAVHAVPASPFAVAALVDRLLETRRSDEAMGLLLGQAADDVDAPLSLQVRFLVACRDTGADRGADRLAHLRLTFETGVGEGMPPFDCAQALFALEIEGDPVRALDHALNHWRDRRETSDLCLLARCAIAARRGEVVDALRAFVRHARLRDRRIDQALAMGGGRTGSEPIRVMPGAVGVTQPA